MSLSSQQRVTQVVAYLKMQSSTPYLYRIDFSLSNQQQSSQTTSLEVSSNSGSSLTAYTFNTPVGKEFVGFYIGQSSSGGSIYRLAVYYRDIDCTQNSNLVVKVSSNLGSKNIFATGSSTDTATVYDTTSNFCGAVTITVSYATSLATPNLITGSSVWSASSNKGIVTITENPSSDLADESAYTITIQAKYDLYPASTVSATATYEYLGCNSATLTSFDISNFNVAVGSTQSGQSNLWYDSISGSASAVQRCGAITGTISITSGDISIFQLSQDASNSILTASPTLASQMGTYTVQIQYCLTSYSSSCKTRSTTVTITGCQITGSSPSSKSITVFDAATSYSISSLANFVASSTAACGTITYSVSESSSSSPISTLNIDATGLALQAQSYSLDQVGIHSVTLTATSAQSSVSLQKSFQITVVDPCSTTTLNWITSPSAMTTTLYELDASGGASSATQQISASELISTTYSLTNACGLISFSISEVPASGVASFSAGQLSITSSGLIQVWTDVDLSVGLHTATVVAQLASHSSVTSSRSFQLTVLDNCLLTLISYGPTSVENFVTFAGQNATSLIKYSFNDTRSVLRTKNTDSADFCGEKILSFLVNSSDTSSFLVANNQDYIYFSPPSSTKLFGEGQAQLVVSMKDYPAIVSSPITFKATILGSEVPVINDQLYSIGSETLTIIYEPFKVLPAGYVAPLSTVVAYILASGSQLPSHIDLSCSCLTPVNDLPWISHSPSTNSFQVSTTDSPLVGDWQVVIVQIFESQFTDVNPYSKFKLTIQPAFIKPTTKKSAPYFRPSLETQTVQQCPGQTIKMWTYTLPETVDPNDSPVNILVNFDKSYFEYENSTKTINQIKVANSSINQTIKITLKDDYNISATFTFEVQFYCKSSASSFNFSFQEKLDSVAKQKIWPKAQISQIESNGLMHVKFDRKMKIPEHPEYIQNETIILNETTYPILKIAVIPGKFSEKTMLGFNWTFIKFSPIEMLIQLDFENLSYISSHGSDPDFIQLTIFGFQLFADIYGNYMQPPTITKPKQIPQVVSQQEMAFTQSIVNSAKGAMQSAMLANTIVSVLISGPLQQLLASIKSLQIIVHVVLINVVYPATVTTFFSMLINVLTFQFYDFTEIYNKILSLDPNDEGFTPLNSQFELMGYSTLFIIQNFGTLCWSLLFMPTVYAITPLIVALCQGEYAHLRKKASQMMFFNYWLGFINETYLFLAVCAGLNLFYFRWDSYGKSINTFLAIFFGTVLAIFPLFVAVFYTLPKNYQKITSRDQNFQARFGNVITGLNFKRQKRSAIIRPVTCYLRKFWLAFIVIFQQSSPTFCIFQVNFQALIMMTISGYTNPMISKTSNTMDLVNEIFVLLMTYHLYMFTDFLLDLKMRSLVGFSLIATTLLIVVLSIGVVVVQTLILSIWKLKIYRLKILQARAIKKRFEKKLLQVEIHEIKLKVRAKAEQVERRLKRAQAERERMSWYQVGNLQRQNISVPIHENQLVFGNPQMFKPKVNLQTNLQINDYELNRLNTANFNIENAQNSSFSATMLDNQPILKLRRQEQVQINEVKNFLQEYPLPIPNVQNNPTTQPKGILKNSKYRSKSMIAQVFEPPVVEAKTLMTFSSQYYNKKIEVQEIKRQGLLQEFAVVVQNQHHQSFEVDDKFDQESIKQQLKQAEYCAQELKADLDGPIKSAIQSGEFDDTLQKYARQRTRWLKFGHSFDGMKTEDLGELAADMDLKSKIDLYTKILKSKSQWRSQDF